VDASTTAAADYSLQAKIEKLRRMKQIEEAIEI